MPQFFSRIHLVESQAGGSWGKFTDLTLTPPFQPTSDRNLLYDTPARESAGRTDSLRTADTVLRAHETTRGLGKPVHFKIRGEEMNII